jgi:hypothetical protein
LYYKFKRLDQQTHLIAELGVTLLLPILGINLGAGIFRQKWYPAMALTPFAINAARPKDRPFKLVDGDGLHLLVQPNGNKFWHFRYQLAGTGKKMALGAPLLAGEHPRSSCA